MKKIAEVLEGIRTVGILGHVRPDGDCVGSCLGLYLYLKENYPEIQTDVYLEQPRAIFDYLEGFQEIHTEVGREKEPYDLFISLDASSRDRLGVAGELFDQANNTVCIDHHISNTGFARINHVRGEVSSSCEVLYNLLEPEKISRETAVALYTGIIHDTGVFQYSSASPETMRIAGELMKHGFDFNKIIDQSFYEKTYVQNQVMGRVLAESILLQNKKCIVGYLKKRDMEFYGVTGADLDGIVSQLRLTKGVEAAIFVYEFETQKFKASLRSNGGVDVSKVAVFFGGGGHVRAAGCEMSGTLHDVINNLSDQIAVQLKDVE